MYDAFIPYSHAKDKPVAAALQSVIQKPGKPWYRRRGLRVFRDDTSLSATPQLWPSIEQALAQSRYLIVLASPEAAASPWMAKEVEYWLAHKSPDTLFVGLTDGELAWDGRKGDFKWSAELVHSKTAMLDEFAQTYLAAGDLKAALQYRGGRVHSQTRCRRGARRPARAAKPVRRARPSGRREA